MAFGRLTYRLPTMDGLLNGDELIGMGGEHRLRAFVSSDNARNGFLSSAPKFSSEKHVSDENSSGLAWDAGFTD